MGSSASQEDEKKLLDDDEEIQPIFEELKLVLIGSQGAGKNAIANAIFGEKVFTFWTACKYEYVKKTRTVSGTTISLTRTPGWRGDLSRSGQTQSEIVHCVQTLYNTGPHAVLLVLHVNSVLSIESTISTLENLLTVQLWKHTIVVFTGGEKLGHYSIEDHIRSKNLQPLIDKCENRYFVICKNDSDQIIEKIEEHIVRKNSTSCFKLSAPTQDTNTLLSDWTFLVERIKSKIASIKETLKKEENEDSKDAEIRRLRNLLRDKERKIESLQIESSQCRAITEMQYDMMRNELKESNTENKRLKTEIKKLKEELQMWQQKAVGQWTREDQYATVHAGYRNGLRQDLTTVAIRNQNQIQLLPLHSKGSAPCSWNDTLLKILEKLTQDELKKMKYYMCNDIPTSSLEGKDRVDLARLMLTQWGKQQSVLKTRDLLMKIPHIDDDTIELIEPHLKSIGETW